MWKLVKSELGSLVAVTGQAKSEEKVRGFIALLLVGVLIALVFDAPTGGQSAKLVASSKTLAITVIAFYFGLHKGTPQADPKSTRKARANAK